jgi:hypothetical protein
VTPDKPLERTVNHRGRTARAFADRFRLSQFRDRQRGSLRFTDCWRYRLGPTNDEGWYLDQCRFSKLAPAWGEFYEVAGDLLLERLPDSWVVLGDRTKESRHFLFYLRDGTFECDAASWGLSIEAATRMSSRPFVQRNR